jgi:hypothetical protein
MTKTLQANLSTHEEGALHFVKRGLFNSEEGALRGKPSHASCHAVSFGEKVASKCVMVCAHH